MDNLNEDVRVLNAKVAQFCTSWAPKTEGAARTEFMNQLSLLLDGYARVATQHQISLRTQWARPLRNQ